MMFKKGSNYGKPLILGLLIFWVFIGQAVEAASDPIKDDNFSKVAKNGVKKIIIPSFQVTFRTLVSDTAKSKSNFFGSANDPKSTASMVVNWPNADKAMLQKTANEAYREFAQKLAASGLEVVPMASVTGSAAYKQLNGSAEPVVKESYIIMAPAGMTIYDPMAKLDPNGGFTLGVFNTNMKCEGDIVKELNGDFTGVAVARVSLIVSIGGYKKEGSISNSGTTTTASASIAFDPRLSLHPSLPTDKLGGYIGTSVTVLSNYYVMEGYKISGNMAKDTSRVWIEGALSSEIVAGSLQETTTTGEKVGMAFVNVLGALSGQSASLKKYEFTVDPASYEQGTREIVGKFSEMIGNRIKGSN